MLAVFGMLFVACQLTTGSVLTPAQVETFKREGVLVVPGILSPDEIAAARAGLHRTLRRLGVEPHAWDDPVSQAALRSIQLTGGKGGIVDIYYNEWAMKLRTHPRMFGAISELWEATWADPDAEPLWKAPRSLQPFNASHGFAYIDRAVYRLPLPGSGQRGSLQPGLMPHYDQCPLDLFGERGLLDKLQVAGDQSSRCLQYRAAAAAARNS